MTADYSRVFDRIGDIELRYEMNIDSSEHWVVAVCGCGEESRRDSEYMSRLWAGTHAASHGERAAA